MTVVSGSAELRPVVMDDRAAAADPMRVVELLRATYETDLGEVSAFLPDRVPLDELPGPFEHYVSACAELPARYPKERGGVRRWLEREFACEDPAVTRALTRLSTPERETLMTAVSVLGHTYRWDAVPPAPERFAELRIPLPPGIAAPWTELARVLDQPRVGTTWSLHLCNWKVADRPAGASYRPEELRAESLRVARNWLPPPADAHLERFSLSFVLLEARGAFVLRHVLAAVGSAASRRLDDTLQALKSLEGAIAAMTRVFSLHVRKRTVDPRMWLNVVQPTFAWSAEATSPGRVEGGPSGMQLPTIQALDAAFRVLGESTLARGAMTARALMPRPHRRFLKMMDMAGPVLRRFVVDARCDELTQQYNRCIGGLANFRAVHQSRAALYLRSADDDGRARVSTGLTIGVDDNAVAVAERTMSERMLETKAAAV